MKRKIFILLFIVAFVELKATNYYVSPTGNDGNSGLSPENAFLTLQHAAETVAGGDTVLVSDGNFTGFDIREVYGSALMPVVFKAIGTEAVISSKGPRRNDGINVENCSYIVIDGFNVKNMPGDGNGIRLVLSDYCTVRNCWCDNNAERGIFTGFTNDILIEHNRCSNSIDEHGIYVSNSSHRPIVRYNECWGNNNIGIHMNGDLSMGEDGIISDAQIYGNYLHDNNLAAGINLDGALTPVIYNNIIVNNHSAQGIALFQMDGAIVTHGAKIYNNTIVVPDDGRWGILLADGAQVNTEIYNNIIVSNHSWRGCISAENTSGLKSDYNILSNSMGNAGDGSSISFTEWQGLGFDQHSILSGNFDELFTDYASSDFSIPYSSLAVNAGNGQLVSALVPRDFINEPRPSGGEYDIGAYEYSFPISSKVQKEGSLVVYPNPAVNFIFVKGITGKHCYELYNISGQLVRKGKSTQGMPISIEGLSEGTCILKLVTSESNVHYTKFAVSNVR